MSYSNNGRGRAPRYNNNRGNHYGNQRGGQRAPQQSKIDKSRYISAAAEYVPDEVYEPTHSFSDFGLNDQLLANVVKRGYDQPTPIQDQTIPLLMAGKDVVGIANTGTGKTAAFLLPLMNKVIQDQTQGVLILTPTRELAMQIFDELQAFSSKVRIDMTLCIGGKNLSRQVLRLKGNPHFVIGTPGRVKDLVQRRAFKSELYTNIVLDEVDRMLDIGFRKDILELIRTMPGDRQAALFSATMNHETEEIMNQFLSNPEIVSVKQRETVANIHQDVVKIKPGESKVDVLHQLLRQTGFEKVLVFGRTKRGVNKLEEQLDRLGIKVCAIHGNKNQNARQRSLQAFKNGHVQAMLATDVASRGIDVDGVTHVINYDEPMTYDDYVHRIGRTGRAGNSGKAITFVM